MVFTLYGEEFNIRTDNVDKVERFGNSVEITYKDGSSERWTAKDSYQIVKVNFLEIVLRAIEVGYKNGFCDGIGYNNCSYGGKKGGHNDKSDC